MGGLAQPILTIVGGAFGGPWGAMLGSAIGSWIDAETIDPPTVEGPRLNDLKVQKSSFAEPIPLVYGTSRISGNLIWAADIVEHEHTENVGGKGGSPGVDQKSYTYTCSFAVLLSESELIGVRKVWANGELIYDVSSTNTGPTIKDTLDGGGGFIAALAAVVDAKANPLFTFYPGTATQGVDPTIEAHLGAGNVPAYRGRSYVVFTDLLLTDYGNQIPNLTFEVVSAGTVSDTVTVFDTPQNLAESSIYNPVVNEIWSTTYNTTDIVSRYALDGTHLGYISYNPKDPDYPFYYGVGEYTLTYSEKNSAIFIHNLDYITCIDAATGVVRWTIKDPTGLGIECLAVGEIKPYVFVITGVGSGSNWFRLDMRGFEKALLFGTHTNVSPAYDGVIPLGHVFGLRGDVLFFDIPDQPFEEDCVYLVDNAGPQNLQAHILRHNVEFGQNYGAGSANTYYTPAFFQDPPEFAKRMYLSMDRGRRYVWSIVCDDVTNKANNPWRLEAFEADRMFVFEPMKTVALPTELGTANTVLFARFDETRDLMWIGYNTGSISKLVGIRIIDGGVYKTISFSNVIIEDIAICPGAGYIFTHLWSPSQSRYNLARISLDRIAAASVPLDTVVSSISQASGLLVSEIDVTGLSTELVDGYVVSRQSTGRSALENLRTAYMFDAVESSGKVRFTLRGTAAQITIPKDDLAAHEAGEEVGPTTLITRKQELELPRSVSIVYPNPAIDYEQDAQTATRQTVTTTKDQIKIEVPVVMSASKALQIAESIQANAWMGRTKYTFSTTIKYSYLEPGDLVTVEDAVVRLVKKTEQGILIQWEAVHDDSDIWNQTTEGVEPPQRITTISVITVTQLLTLELPPLNDQHNTMGVYLGASGLPGGDWNGAVIYKDTGLGQSFLFAMTAATTWGKTLTALPRWKGGSHVDESSILRVALVAGTLSAITREKLLMEGNALAVGSPSTGWEILCFRDAVQEIDGSWTLTGLLRGRRGTEQLFASHTANEYVVLLDTKTMRLATGELSELGTSVDFSATSIGSSHTTDTALSIQGTILKPLSPCRCIGVKESNGDFTLRWIRRTRIAGGWNNYGDVPLGEDSEAYELEILRPDGTVARTVTGLTAQSTTYTSAQQSTDFTAPMWVRRGVAGAVGSYRATFSTITNVEAVLVDGDDIYIGINGGTSAAQVWRQYQNQAWELIGGDGFFSSWAAGEANRVNCLFKDGPYLYAGLGGSTSGKAELWRYNGDAWIKLGGDGVNSGWTGLTDVLTIAKNNGKIVAGTGGAAGEGEVWEWDQGAWTKVGGDGVLSSWNTNYEQVRSLCSHQGLLYAGLGSSANDAEVWRQNANGTWTQIGGDSLNSGWTIDYEEAELTSDGTTMYAGLGNSSGDSEVWSWNGTAWTKIGGDSLNSSWAASGTTDDRVKLAVCKGTLYAGLGGSSGRAEVWKWNGSAWSQVGGDGINSSWSAKSRVYQLASDGQKLAASVDTETWSVPDPASAVPTPLEYRVYQVSAQVGRGFAGNGKVDW